MWRTPWYANVSVPVAPEQGLISSGSVPAPLKWMVSVSVARATVGASSTAARARPGSQASGRRSRMGVGSFGSWLRMGELVGAVGRVACPAYRPSLRNRANVVDPTLASLDGIVARRRAVL